MRLIVHRDRRVDDRVAIAAVPHLVLEPQPHRVQRQQIERLLRLDQCESTQALRRDQRRVVLDPHVRDDCRWPLVDAEGYRDAVPITCDGGVHRRLAVSALPVIDADPQHVALQLIAVEIVLLDEGRGPAERAEQLIDERATLRLLRRDALGQVHLVDVIGAEQAQLAHFGRFALVSARLREHVWRGGSEKQKRQTGVPSRDPPPGEPVAAHGGRESSKPRAQSRQAGVAEPRRPVPASLLSGYRPLSSASFDDVAPMRLISHSIADCGGIWLSPRRSVYTPSSWSGRNSFSSRRVPLVPMSIAG